MNGHDALAAALLRAVQQQDFPATADGWQAGRPLGLMPSIDLALVVFAPGRAPRWANVLFSREHAGGVVARIGADAGPVRNIRFDADQRDDRLESPLWAPGADWSRASFAPLWGPQEPPGLRFVAPYPASLLKLMVAVGVGLAVDAGRCAWPDALEPMIAVSSNEATDECVALLHRVRMIDALNARLQALALPTLRLGHTTPSGGWRNKDGAGVGRIHMTAWDTVRLLWLLDADAPPAPWLPAGPTLLPLLQPATRDHLRGVLQRQQLDEVLSSGALRGLPGWVAGGPDAPAFAHKTGTTDNYASDAGIVKTDGLHYLVAVLTTLGRRYAPHERCATTWRLPALGAAVERIVRSTA